MKTVETGSTGPPPIGAGARRLIGMIVGLVVLGATSVHASDGFGAWVEGMKVRGDSVHADVRLSGLFSDRIRDGLSRSLPMTYTLEVQLWRNRSGWWDALEERQVKSFRIQRSVWNDRYLLVDGRNQRRWLPDLDALERALSERTDEYIAPASKLKPGKTYYIVVIPTLQPLTIKDIQEVEAWLTGEIDQGREKGGLGVITGLPRFVFGVFIDVTGLGDKSTIARSEPFRFAPPESAEPDSADGGAGRP